MIEELKTFIAVVESGSFTKAAEVINLSQPSVSIHIKNLEKYFNVNIITRSNKQRNILITENGELLYKRAKEIIKVIEITKDELKNLDDTVKGHLRIGASLTIGEYFLPKFLGEFAKKYPEIQVEVVIGNTEKICDDVKTLKLDIGIIEGVSSSYDFRQEFFSEDKMVLMIPFNHELVNCENFLDLLQNEKWICREQGSGTREYLNLFLTRNKIKPKSMMVLGSNYSIKEAVRNNLGITLISSYVAEEAASNKEVSLIQLNEDYKRSFSYILPKDMLLTRAVEAFIEQLQVINKGDSDKKIK